MARKGGEKGAGVTAVATIVGWPSGIISRKHDNVTSQKDLVGSAELLTELAMLKTVESRGGTLKVEKYANNDSNSITPIANGVFDTAWIWLGRSILAKSPGCRC